MVSLVYWVVRRLLAVDDIAAALRLDGPIVVSHSMGGGIALLPAAERGGIRTVDSVESVYSREASDLPQAYAARRRSERPASPEVSEQELDRWLTIHVLYSSMGCPGVLVCSEHGWKQGETLVPELQRRVDATPRRGSPRTAALRRGRGRVCRVRTLRGAPASLRMTSGGRRCASLRHTSVRRDPRAWSLETVALPAARGIASALYGSVCSSSQEVNRRPLPANKPKLRDGASRERAPRSDGPARR